MLDSAGCARCHASGDFTTVALVTANGLSLFLVAHNALMGTDHHAHPTAHAFLPLIEDPSGLVVPGQGSGHASGYAFRVFAQSADGLDFKARKRGAFDPDSALRGVCCAEVGNGTGDAARPAAGTEFVVGIDASHDALSLLIFHGARSSSIRSEETMPSDDQPRSS